MAKRSYIGVNGIARKIRRGYIGESGLARKVRKGYIGVAGVACPFWSGGEVTHVGRVETPTVRRYMGVVPGSTKDFALYSGGATPPPIAPTSAMDAYASSLTRTSPTAMTVARFDHAFAGVGGAALFAAGSTNQSGKQTTASVNAYDNALTRSTPANLRESKAYPAGVSLGGQYALFAAGRFANGSYSVSADAYDNALTRTSAADCHMCWNQIAASVGDAYGLVMGSVDSNATVSAYDTALTRTATTTSATIFYPDVISVGDYAIVMHNYGAYSDVFDTALTRTTGIGLSVARRRCATSRIGDEAGIFASGVNSSNAVQAQVDVFDESLTRKTVTGVSIASGSPIPVGAPAGPDHALFVSFGTSSAPPYQGDAYAIL